MHGRFLISAIMDDRKKDGHPCPAADPGSVPERPAEV